jgi:hypothetical protein
MKRHTSYLAATFVASLALGACGSSGDNEDTGNDDAADGGDGGSGTSAADDGVDDGVDDGATGDETGGVPEGCADPNDAMAPRESVSADLEGGGSWTCDTIYVLEAPVFVRNGTLSIEPGTTIQGAAGSALVIDSTATLDAVGAADAPIVFTSILPEGSRNRGDWGGIVLLGNAPINLAGGVGAAEGFANPPAYGGTDAAHDCGSLSYVRVEWAGFEISAGNELNGVTFYACGTGTSVDHLQVHMGSDDGIEMFGGEFAADHLIVTGAADDSLDCDEGFAGQLQYVFIQQDPAVGDNCFEWSNQGSDFSATPHTAVRVANVTCIGSGAGGDKSKGMTLKEGTEAYIYSSIFTNITNEAVLLTHPETQANAEAGLIDFAGVIFNGTFGTDDGTMWTGADLETWIMGLTGNLTDDPALPSVSWGSVNGAPAGDSPAAGAGQTPSGFEATSYAGAIEPGGEDWTKASWTNYSL